MRNIWDQRYSESIHLYGSEPNKFIQLASENYRIYGNTLAIAEGDGRNILYLAQQAKERKINFTAELWDYSKVALERAKHQALRNNIKLDTNDVDLTNVIWPTERFDHVVCVYGHVDSKTQKRTLLGVRQALKNGGRFIGEVYSKQQLYYLTGGPRDEDFLYDINDFIEIFKYDNLLHLFTGEVERYEGELHNGKCHVIQFIIEIRK